MESLFFAYSLSCYSIGIIGLAVAFIAAIARPSPLEKAYLRFMFAFALVAISAAIGPVVSDGGAKDRFASAVAGFINISGCALILMTLPRFAEILVPWRFARPARRLFFALGILFWLAGVMFWFTDRIGPIMNAFVAVLATAIAYVTIAGAVGSSRSDPEGIPEPDLLRWDSLMKKIRWLAIGFAPLLFAIDFFPDSFRWANWFLPRTLRAAPLFYAIWSGYYIAATIPVLIGPHRAPMGGAAESAALAAVAEYGLSPRELEVARLLTEGLSYKAIADILSISLATVKTHVIRAYRKTGARTKIELQGKLEPRNGLRGTHP